MHHAPVQPSPTVAAVESAPLLSRLLRSRALWLIALFVLLAIVTRFYALGERALHHDENLHAFYSYELYDKGVYQHDPLMHGPLLFHLTALGYLIFGDTDATARLWPALLGIFLVWVPWAFREWLGRRGAVAASLLMLVSPTILYYSRFIRHDIFAAAWTAIIVYGMFAYLARGKRSDLLLMMGGWALYFSQKEVAYMIALIFWLFWAIVALVQWRRGLALRESRAWHLMVTLGAVLLPLSSAAVLHLIGRDPPGGYNAATYQNVGFLQTAGSVTVALLIIGLVAGSYLWHRRTVLLGALLFYAIYVLLHTTMLTWPWGIGSGLVGSLGYWIEQHGVERGDQPWYYYLMLLPLYEFLPLLLVFGYGLLRMWDGWRVQRAAGGERSAELDTVRLWPWFLLWWFVTITFALSFAGEKMPWLLVHIALPLVLLGGWSAGQLLRADWLAVLRRPVGMLAVALFAVAWLALAHLLWMAIGSELPFRNISLDGLAVTNRWLAALLLIAVALVVARRLRTQLGRGGASRAAQLALLGLLLLATVRFAWIVTYRNADLPNEPLIYTQTSPQVTMVVDELETISRATTGGLDLKVAYDNEVLWAFSWYLRHFPNKVYYATSPASQQDAMRDAPVILVGLNQESIVQPYTAGYIRHEYSMRPNFPENYKRIIPYAERTDPNTGGTIQVKQAWNVIRLLDNALRSAVPTQARLDLRDFLWNRRVRELGNFYMVVYVKPEIASQVWEYGLNVAAIDPELVKDPYTDKIQVVSATAAIGDPGTISQPRAVAPLPDGRVAAVDTAQHRVVVLNADGTPANSFGGMGSEPGQFNEPWGIAAAPDGTLYIADTWNHRIQHVTTEGEVLHVWGTFGETQGQLTTPSIFYGPRDVAVDGEGHVWVTDTGNSRVQQFEADGTFIAQFGGKGSAPGQFSEPVGITVAADGTIWVADTWNRRVQGFMPNFAPFVQFPVRAWAGQSLTNKPSLAVSADRVWISDPDANRILEFNRQGEILRLWGQMGTDLTSLSLPLGLALDADGTLWVADSTNGRLLKFEEP